MADQEAERWAIRRDAGPLSADEERLLAEWLAADCRREGALLRAEAVLSYLDRGRALSRPNRHEDRHAPHGWLSRRTAMFGAPMAALSAAAVGGFFFLPSRADEFDTGVGELRRVALRDGSVVSINTSSRLTVALAPEKRLLAVKSGEAWIQVKPDKARPFLVEIGDVRVRAVGTAFSVRQRDTGVDILVTEGVVETWVVGHEDDRRRMAAGTRGFVAADTKTIQAADAPEDINRALAWRAGEVALDGDSLATAVAELNRYNHRKIVVNDALLERTPLVGYFRINEPESFGRAVADMTGARLVIESDRILLER